VGVLKTLIHAFGEWFTDQDAILGNHDMRAARATKGEITIDDLLEYTAIRLGQYSYMYVWNPRTHEWTYVCHQFNYCKISVRLAQEVWTVVTAPDGYDNATGERIPDYNPQVHGWNKQKCHVVITHTHVAQHGYSPDDSWNCIGMGCMREQRRTKYTQARATKFPKWNNAFVMMKNGRFTTMSMKRTDWRRELRDDCRFRSPCQNRSEPRISSSRRATPRSLHGLVVFQGQNCRMRSPVISALIHCWNFLPITKACPITCQAL